MTPSAANPALDLRGQGHAREVSLMQFYQRDQITRRESSPRLLWRRSRLIMLFAATEITAVRARTSC